MLPVHRARGTFERDRELAASREQVALIAAFVRQVTVANGKPLSPAVLVRAIDTIEQDLADTFWLAGRDFDEQSHWGAQAEEKLARAEVSDAAADDEGYWALGDEWEELDAQHPIQFTPQLMAVAAALAIELVGERWVLLSHAARSNVATEILGDVRIAYDRA